MTYLHCGLCAKRKKTTVRIGNIKAMNPNILLFLPSTFKCDSLEFTGRVKTNGNPVICKAGGNKGPSDDCRYSEVDINRS